MTNTFVQDRPVTQAGTIVGERRRPGRIANPSPELIALMRKPSAEAVKRLALYDAPNFVLPQETTRARVHPGHSVRILCAVCICIGFWGGAVTAMMSAWG